MKVDFNTKLAGVNNIYREKQIQQIKLVDLDQVLMVLIQAIDQVIEPDDHLTVDRAFGNVVEEVRTVFEQRDDTTIYIPTFYPTDSFTI